MECLLCGKKKSDWRNDIVKHHTLYDPPICISVCTSCHARIHRGGQFAELRPNTPRCPICDHREQWRRGIKSFVCKNWHCPSYWKYGKTMIDHLNESEKDAMLQNFADMVEKGWI